MPIVSFGVFEIRGDIDQTMSMSLHKWKKQTTQKCEKNKFLYLEA